MKPAITVGDRFGAWEATERIAGSRHRHPSWVCRCDCGTLKTVDQDNLTSGRSTSCGCIKHVNGMFKHGMNRSPVMGVWRTMISRCTDPNNAQYHDYGGRGIKVHSEWLEFEKFYAAVGDRPAPGLTFDRENNAGNYEPGNVRWATWAVQTRNKRTNRMVVFNGWDRCVQDWANELGVTWHHLYRRHKKGMSWQEAIQDVIDHPPKVRGALPSKSIKTGT